MVAGQTQPATATAQLCAAAGALCEAIVHVACSDDASHRDGWVPVRWCSRLHCSQEKFHTTAVQRFPRARPSRANASERSLLLLFCPVNLGDAYGYA
jgi:hypothetical protein